jgi:acetyl-CoA synthetase
VVTAFIVPAAGHAPTPALAAEIQVFVKQRLAAHAYPRTVRFIAAMPTTVTGKIRRTELRRRARGEKD